MDSYKHINDLHKVDVNGLINEMHRTSLGKGEVAIAWLGQNFSS